MGNFVLVEKESNKVRYIHTDGTPISDVIAELNGKGNLTHGGGIVERLIVGRRGEEATVNGFPGVRWPTLR